MPPFPKLTEIRQYLYDHGGFWSKQERDEFYEQYPDAPTSWELSAVFIDDGTGSLDVAVSKREIDQAQTLDDLMTLVAKRLSET